MSEFSVFTHFYVWEMVKRDNLRKEKMNDSEIQRN